MRKSAKSKQVQKLQVAQRPCTECLFSKNRIVRQNRAAEIVEQCEAQDKFFECHKGTLAGKVVVCAGFWQRYQRDILILRLALYLQHFELVNVEQLEEKK